MVKVRKYHRALLDTPPHYKRNQIYWDGDSWIRKGFARDAHGEVVEDKNWKLFQTSHPLGEDKFVRLARHEKTGSIRLRRLYNDPTKPYGYYFIVKGKKWYLADN